MISVLLGFPTVTGYRLRPAKSISLNQEPYQIVFLDDGRSIAVVGSRGIVTYALSPLRKKFAIHGNWRNIATLKGSESLAFVGQDGVGIASTRGRRSHFVSLEPVQGVEGLAASCDGKVIGVSMDQSLYVYDVATERLLWSQDLGDSYVGQLTGTEEGIAVALWGNANGKGGSLLDWEPRTPSTLRTVSFNGNGPYSLGFARATGKIYVGCTDGKIYVVNLQVGKASLVGQPRHQLVQCLAASPGGSYLVLGYESDLKSRKGRNLLLLLDSASGKVIARYSDTYGVPSAAFAPTGRYLAIGDRGGTVKIVEGSF